MVRPERVLQLTELGDPRIKTYRIDKDKKDYPIDSMKVLYYVAEGKQTVKIEGLENHLHDIPANTIHCFIGPAGAPSFAEHYDTCNVTILCIQGKKTLEIQGVKHVLNEGESVDIPKGVFHKATNEFDSIILSIGD